jgi:hypothetical protein
LRGQRVDVESAFGTEHGGCFFFSHFADAEELSFEVAKGKLAGTGVAYKEL